MIQAWEAGGQVDGNGYGNLTVAPLCQGEPYVGVKMAFQLAMSVRLLLIRGAKV